MLPELLISGLNSPLDCHEIDAVVFAFPVVPPAVYAQIQPTSVELPCKTIRIEGFIKIKEKNRQLFCNSCVLLNSISCFIKWY